MPASGTSRGARREVWLGERARGTLGRALPASGRTRGARREVWRGERGMAGGAALGALGPGRWRRLRRRGGGGRRCCGGNRRGWS